MKKILFILLLISTILWGCQEQKPGKILEKECGLDSECKVSGCNGEICGKEEMMSICIYKPEFECYKLTNCKCIDEKCGWEQTEEFLECLSKHK